MNPTTEQQSELIVTVKWLREQGACPDGVTWFEHQTWLDASAQAVLDRLTATDHVEWALWLLRRCGTPQTITQIDGDFSVDGSKVLLGSLRVSGRIVIGEFLALSGSIEAGGGIKAGEGIEAGGGIKAGEGIEAGLSVQCGLVLSVKLRIFAGLVSWRLPSTEEQEIRCKRLAFGVIGHGTLIETASEQATSR